MTSRSYVIQGVSVPSFFYGTAWKEERTEDLTRLALAAGFTAIDTANQRKHYFEAGVGAAVAKVVASGKSRREDLFLQTKFTYARGQDHRLPYDPEAPFAIQVEQSFARSLEHLQTSYIDSLVLHGPYRGDGLAPADWEVWHAMEKLHRSGAVRLIGVSNIGYEQLAELHAGASVKPAIVQNRCYARDGWDRDVRALCRAREMRYQGFSLLTANRRELGLPKVQRIVERMGCTVAQLVFRFALDVGMIVLTGTTSAAHMAEDLAASDIALDPADRSVLEAL